MRLSLQSTFAQLLAAIGSARSSAFPTTTDPVASVRPWGRIADDRQEQSPPVPSRRAVFV